MSVDVMDTTEGIASSAMSAKEGSADGARAGRRRASSRWASDRGVTLTEPATTIPKMTAAAISAENESARFVDFCMTIALLLFSRGIAPGTEPGTRV